MSLISDFFNRIKTNNSGSFSKLASSSSEEMDHMRIRELSGGKKIDSSDGIYELSGKSDNIDSSSDFDNLYGTPMKQQSAPSKLASSFSEEMDRMRIRELSGGKKIDSSDGIYELSGGVMGTSTDYGDTYYEEEAKTGGRGRR